MLRRTTQTLARAPSLAVARQFSSRHPLRRELPDQAAIDDFLSTRSWSVRSLLPSAADVASSNEVTPAQLRHLLRLSALQAPASAEEEAKMLRDLHSQLHFVRQVQGVDTAGVQPLRSLRDESRAAQEEDEIGVETLREAFNAEEVVGRYHKRIRRRKVDDPEARAAEDWDVMGQAERKVGRYFVVESGEKEA